MSIKGIRLHCSTEPACCLGLQLTVGFLSDVSQENPAQLHYDKHCSSREAQLEAFKVYLPKYPFPIAFSD